MVEPTVTITKKSLQDLMAKAQSAGKGSLSSTEMTLIQYVAEKMSAESAKTYVATVVPALKEATVEKKEAYLEFLKAINGIKIVTPPIKIDSEALSQTIIQGFKNIVKASNDVEKQTKAMKSAVTDFQSILRDNSMKSSKDVDRQVKATEDVSKKVGMSLKELAVNSSKATQSSGKMIVEAIEEKMFPDYPLSVKTDGGNLAVSRDNPLPVILTDEKGTFYKAVMQAISGGGGGGQSPGRNNVTVGGIFSQHVHDSTTAKDGDFEPLHINEHGILRTQAQQHLDIEFCNKTTGWSVLGTDTVNLATTVNHVFDDTALEFDKVNGVAGTVFAGIQKTMSSLSLEPYHKGGGFFLWSFYVSDISNIDYLFLRLGTDSTNYNEFRIPDTNLVAGWNYLRAVMASPTAYAGNGWDSDAVTYVAVGAAFDAAANLLADIAVDHITVNTGLQTATDINSTISSSTTSPNIRLIDYGGSISTGLGVAGGGTLRVAIASDTVFSGGVTAVPHGANPTAVAAGVIATAKANRAGIPFVIGGHPNIITRRDVYSNQPQTDTALVAVGAGAKIVVTRITATSANSSTNDMGFIVGFGAANTPTGLGVVASHPGIAPGSGIVEGDGSGILGVGADGEDLRLTSTGATGVFVIVTSYYTIES